MENRPQIEIPLTTFDKIQEKGAWILFLTLWCAPFWFWTSLPEQVPTHFGFDGSPDHWGSKNTIFLLPIITTFLFALLTIVNRYPHSFNYLKPITPENALGQYTSATRMIRKLKMLLLFWFNVILWQIVQTAQGMQQMLGKGFIFLFLGSILGLIGYHTYQMSKLAK